MRIPASRPRPATTDVGMIFSPTMVRALLAGEKTQTRRLVSRNNSWINGSAFRNAGAWDSFCPPRADWMAEPGGVRVSRDGLVWQLQPRIARGSVLWVRETIVRGEFDVGHYAADGAISVVDTWPWQRDTLSSMHMPRGARRLELDVETADAQRISEISPTDALAEGVASFARDHCGGDLAVSIKAGIPDAILYTFRLLWESIHGAPPRDEWVWRYTFRVRHIHGGAP